MCYCAGLACAPRLTSVRAKVGLTYSENGVLHFGDHVMLYSATTQGVLSADIAEEITTNTYSVTTSTAVKGPVARNVFVIVP